MGCRHFGEDHLHRHHPDLQDRHRGLLEEEDHYEEGIIRMSFHREDGYQEVDYCGEWMDHWSLRGR